MRESGVARSIACVVVFGNVICSTAVIAGSIPSEADGHSTASGEQPTIEGGQRYVFTGQTVCICGFFPTPESRAGLQIGGVPAGEPVSSSATMIELRIPDGIAPGPHTVTGLPSAGFDSGSTAEIVVLGLGGSIDRERLRSGQATPMRIRISGTAEPLELRLTNETPQIIAIEGGDEGVVSTSGGDENVVERTVRGLKPGDFNISYEVDNDPCPCAPGSSADTAAESGTVGPPVRTGYPLPDGVTVVGEPRGTGRTTGHIADLTVVNDGPVPVVFPDRPVFVPGRNGFQSYVVGGGGGTTIPPGGTRNVPIEGYCGDVRKPPVPAGEPLPGIEEWVVPVDSGATTAPPNLTPPETIDPQSDPETAAPYFWGATEAIEEAVDRLQESGELETPFSGNRDREREAVVQQTLWRYAGELTGVPYTREEFEERLEEQYEERSGTPIASAPPEDRERLEEGAEDFWDAFALVGTEAKVIRVEEEVPETPTETVAEEEVVEPPCDIAKSMEHSEPDSDFKMSESYKDEDKRANLEEWFEDLPEFQDDVEGAFFERSRSPASSWAIAGRDFIGGYTNAVAKHIYLEADGGTDWVWETELIELQAASNGTHNITVTPPPGGDCETLVVGAGGGMVEAWSNTIDPIADSRDVLFALRVVAGVAIGIATAPLSVPAAMVAAVVTVVATEAFNSGFSSDANAGAAVEGQMVVQVNRRRVTIAANSRSQLFGDGKIESDAAKLSYQETSDTHPTSLTVLTSGRSAVKSEASSNGIAEGTLESQIGVAIVGFCRCGDAVQVEYLTDAGLFLVEEGAAEAARRTSSRLEEMVGEIVDSYMEKPLDEIIPSARDDLPTDLEDMMRRWYLENGDGSGGAGYFPINEESMQ